MTFSADLSNDIGKLRSAIGDDTSASATEGAGVKPDGTNYTDEQLQVYLDGVDHWTRAVPQVLRALANRYALAAKATRVGDYSEDMKAIARELREQAKDWDANQMAGDSMADLLGYNDDSGESPMPFGMEMFGFEPVDQAD